MTKTVAAQIHELSKVVNNLAAANPRYPTLLVMAWAFDDAANLANGRLRHLLDVPAGDIPEHKPAKQPAAQSAPEPQSEPAARRAGRKPKTKTAILNALRSSPGATSAEIAAAVGCRREYVSTVLSRAAERGRVRKEGGVGRGVRWWMEEGA